MESIKVPKAVSLVEMIMHPPQLLSWYVVWYVHVHDHLYPCAAENQVEEITVRVDARSSNYYFLLCKLQKWLKE